MMKRAARELVEVARVVMAHELPRVLAVLKQARVKVDGTGEDGSGVWLKFGDKGEAKRAAVVLVRAGFDARVHTFADTTVRVEYEG